MSEGWWLLSSGLGSEAEAVMVFWKELVTLRAQVGALLHCKRLDRQLKTVNGWDARRNAGRDRRACAERMLQAALLQMLCFPEAGDMFGGGGSSMVGAA